MTPEVILTCLHRAGATIEGEAQTKQTQELTKLDLFYLGLSGGPDSKAKRLALLKKLDLPEYLSSNAMLQALNLLYSKDELYRLIDTL
jgi:ribonuclease M5